MTTFARRLLYGFLVWLVPFAVGFSIFKPLHDTQRDVFENTMGLVLVFSTVLFSNLHFRKLTSGFVWEGILAGVVWMVISLGLDLPMFSWGPMARPLGDYMKDIGMAYFMIPTITIGCGFLLAACRPGAGSPVSIGELTRQGGQVGP